ncbi:hypothetical protein SNEBB_002886, partial [Seison nebaliae]
MFIPSHNGAEDEHKFIGIFYILKEASPDLVGYRMEEFTREFTISSRWRESEKEERIKTELPKLNIKENARIAKFPNGRRELRSFRREENRKQEDQVKSEVRNGTSYLAVYVPKFINSKLRGSGCCPFEITIFFMRNKWILSYYTHYYQL